MNLAGNVHQSLKKMTFISTRHFEMTGFKKKKNLQSKSTQIFSQASTFLWGMQSILGSFQELLGHIRLSDE